LLLDLANTFLGDEDAQTLGTVCLAMPPLLRQYRVKERLTLRSVGIRGRRSVAQELAALPARVRLLVSDRGASIAEQDARLAALRFGVPTAVRIDRRANEDESVALAERLQQLPRSVREVHVLHKVFDRNPWDRSDNGEPACKFDCGMCENMALNLSPEPVPDSQLHAVLQQLPDHIQALTFQQEGSWIDDEEVFYEAVLLPFNKWRLPPALTTLHLPRRFDLDAQGQGAAVQLPSTLTELRLGVLLCHSLARLQLPSSLRVLRFSRIWEQPSEHWPQLPDGLEELTLPETWPHPLTSLRLPDSLCVLHFERLDDAYLPAPSDAKC